jgi:hypothetical protein
LDEIPAYSSNFAHITSGEGLETVHFLASKADGKASNEQITINLKSFLMKQSYEQRITLGISGAHELPPATSLA